MAGSGTVTSTSEVTVPVRNGAENKNGVASDTTVAPGGSGSREGSRSDTKVPVTSPAEAPPRVVLLKARVRMSLTPAEVGVEPSWNAIVWVDGVRPPGVSQVPEKVWVIGAPAVPSETVRIAGCSNLSVARSRQRKSLPQSRSH